MKKEVTNVNIKVVEEVIKILKKIPTEILERLEIEIESELFFRDLMKENN